MLGVACTIRRPKHLRKRSLDSPAVIDGSDASVVASLTVRETPAGADVDEEGMCALISRCTTARSTSIKAGSTLSAGISGGSDDLAASDTEGGLSEAIVGTCTWDGREREPKRNCFATCPLLRLHCRKVTAAPIALPLYYSYPQCSACVLMPRRIAPAQTGAAPCPINLV